MVLGNFRDALEDLPGDFVREAFRWARGHVEHMPRAAEIANRARQEMRKTAERLRYEPPPRTDAPMTDDAGSEP